MMNQSTKPEVRTFDEGHGSERETVGREWAERITAAATDIPRRQRAQTEETYQKPWG